MDYVKGDENHQYSCNWQRAHCDFVNVNLTSDNLRFDLADFHDTYTSETPAQIRSIKFVNSSFPQFPTYLTAKAQKIQRIDTSSCNMKKIGNIFRNKKSTLDTIARMNFTNNQLSFIEDTTFTRVPNLQQLDLSSNQINAIDSRAFEDLNFLTKLDLSNNQISELKSSTFDALKSITELHLQGNRMEIFNFSLLAFTAGQFGTRHLTLLNLASNNIKTMNVIDFAGLKGLEKLDLSNNQLTELNASTIDGMFNLTEINLEGNDLKIFDFTGMEKFTKLVTINLQKNNLFSIAKLMGFSAKRYQVNKNQNALTVNVAGKKWNCAYSKMLVDSIPYYPNVDLIGNDGSCSITVTEDEKFQQCDKRIDELIYNQSNLRAKLTNIYLLLAMFTFFICVSISEAIYCICSRPNSKV
jgi:Leucine-rich repeat (LRR) protein